MTNFQSRLLLTLTVLPTVFASLFWPMKNHLIVIIVFGLAVTVFGSYEFNSLIYKKGIDVRRWFIPTVNSFIYLFAYAVSINLSVSIKAGHAGRYLFPFCLLHLCLYMGVIFLRMT